jgi:hypothetical protein
LLHQPLHSDSHFASALNFLMSLDDIERRDGSRLGAAFNLSIPFFGHSHGPALHVREFHCGNPIPKLCGGCEEQILPRLGDLHLRSWIGQFGSLEFSMFRIRHEASEEWEEASEDDLIVASAE